MLPPDQIIEQTVNKEQKGAGGIVDSPLATTRRWVMSSNVVAKMNENFIFSIDMNKN